MNTAVLVHIEREEKWRAKPELDAALDLYKRCKSLYDELHQKQQVPENLTGVDLVEWLKAVLL